MPKFSISVPDDLWTPVHREGSRVSDTVQQALRLLAAEQRREAGPMANGPDRAGLDRYRPAFESAVSVVADRIRDVLDAGYRFGMLVAPGLAMTDFDLLDDRPVIREALRCQLITTWDGALTTSGSMDIVPASVVETVTPRPVPENSDPPNSPDAPLSQTLYDRFAKLPDLYWASYKEQSSSEPGELARILGSPDSAAPGVRWEEGEREYPIISDMFADAAADALRDVRDESMRRIAAGQLTQDAT